MPVRASPALHVRMAPGERSAIRMAVAVACMRTVRQGSTGIAFAPAGGRSTADRNPSMRSDKPAHTVSTEEEAMRLQKIVTRVFVALGALALVMGLAGNAHAASACKSNCKPLYKGCKEDARATYTTAKALYKQKKEECKVEFPDDADWKPCAADAKAHKKAVKDVKKATVKDCKARYKEVQLPECKLAGLLDECSPAGGFPAGMSGSLF